MMLESVLFGIKYQKMEESKETVILKTDKRKKSPQLICLLKYHNIINNNIETRQSYIGL